LSSKRIDWSDSILDFLVKWFVGSMGRRDIVREVGYCIGDMKEEGKFMRNSYTLLGLEALWKDSLSMVFKRTNIFMGIALWSDAYLEPSIDIVVYDRIVYDFDCEDDPDKAVDIALDFAKNIEYIYGATPIVVKTGFKGAQIVIPSKPIDWSSYQLLWNNLLMLIPKEYRGFNDWNMLQWNRLARVPLTYNIKYGARRLAKIIYPKEYTYEDFSWGELKLLDPSRIVIEKPKIEDLRPRIIRVGKRSTDYWRWIEEIARKGLPDGRARFVFRILAPYLATILNIDEASYMEKAKEFLENSCKNWNRCDKISDSQLRHMYNSAKSKSWKPPRLKKLEEWDPELYTIIAKVLEQQPPDYQHKH